jgi:hypothetical protein
MKTIHLFVFALASALSGQAQYAIDWFTIGGGGMSSGGVYTLVGTIGQPNAGSSTGGNYTLAGGFRSGVTVLQTPGAPLLQIKLLAGNQVVISWPANVTGFILEYTTNLGSGEWSAEPAPVVDTATEHTVTVTALGYKCYRLKQN